MDATHDLTETPEIPASYLGWRPQRRAVRKWWVPVLTGEPLRPLVRVPRRAIRRITRLDDPAANDEAIEAVEADAPVPQWLAHQFYWGEFALPPARERGAPR